MSKLNIVTLASLSPNPGLFVDGPFGSNLKASEYVDKGIPVLRLQNVRPNRYDPNNLRFITEAKAANLQRHRYEAGDVVITKLGEPCGVACQIPKNTPSGVIVADVVRFRGDPSRIDHRYLVHFLNSQDGQRQVSQLAKGTTRQRVNLADLKKIQIPLPPLEEQRRIAAILDKADAVRRKRQEAIALTEELLRAAFLEMFGDPITNLKGWDVKLLGKLCTIRRGASPRPIDAYLGGSVPWIKTGDATESDDIYINKTAEAVTPEGAKKSVYLEPGSLIFANCGVSLGFARILGIGGCIHDGWLSFSDISESLNKIYLLKLLNSVTKHFRRIAPSGTQPNLNTSIMKEFSVPLPPIQLQLEFADIVTKISLEKQHQSEALSAANNLFNSLLQRAFRGEL